MKNFVKWLGIIVFVAIIGFSFTACNKVSLEGTTWEQTDGKADYTIKFGGSIVTLIDGGYSEKGTYTISGNKVTMNFDGEIVIGKISGNTLTMTEEGNDEEYIFTK